MPEGNMQLLHDKAILLLQSNAEHLFIGATICLLLGIAGPAVWRLLTGDPRP